MSFNQNYGVHDPVVDDDVETIFTESEILEARVEEHLAYEEAELETIKDIDAELRE